MFESEKCSTWTDAGVIVAQVLHVNNDDSMQSIEIKQDNLKLLQNAISFRFVDCFLR